jgi:hypothetical protein
MYYLFRQGAWPEEWTEVQTPIEMAARCRVWIMWAESEVLEANVLDDSGTQVWERK